MLTGYTDRSKMRQYLISIITTLVVSVICYFISSYIGYRAVVLILLFTVSFLAVILSMLPVLVAAVLSALIWDFFFIPAFFTFHIEKAEDILMLGMYFTIALMNGILTSRIRYYEKLVRQREDRLNALKLYNAIFNSISHELRTPLTTIMGVTENLSGELQAIPEENKRMLYDELYIASNRLNRVVDNLMNMSRLDFGLIEQALYNIFHNISFHTSENTAAHINACLQEGILEIVISDNGPGFSEEDKDKAFEKFFRSPKAKSGGLGLGLSIARGFVQAHGGDISIENQKTGGALFTIRIPVDITRLNTEHEP